MRADVLAGQRIVVELISRESLLLSVELLVYGHTVGHGVLLQILVR